MTNPPRNRTTQGKSPKSRVTGAHPTDTSEATVSDYWKAHWDPDVIVPDDDHGVAKAAFIWLGVIAAIRAGEGLNQFATDFVADRLEACIKDPKHAGMLLGLVAKQGAKSKDAFYRTLAMSVLRWKNAGLPLKSLNNQSAVKRVAEEFRVGEDVVLRGWKRWRKKDLSARLIPPAL